MALTSVGGPMMQSPSPTPRNPPSAWERMEAKDFHSCPVPMPFTLPRTRSVRGSNKSGNNPPAVDADCLAGDIAGRFRNKPCASIGDVLRHAGPLHGNNLGELLN